MPDLFEEIVRLRRAGEPAALATVVRTEGSSPGAESMKMLVRMDGTHMGTVGGGGLEARVTAAAREVLATDRPCVLEAALDENDPDLGLACGGTVQIFIEPVTVPVVCVFGAGHVGRAVAASSKAAGFRVHLYDDRDGFAAAGPHVDAAACHPWDQAVAAIAPASHHYVIVMTRSHQDDLAVLLALWDQDCQPKFLGMLGSAAKRSKLTAALAAAGADGGFVDRIVTPVGLPIGARTHEEIATSVAAQLVALRRGDGSVTGPH